MSVTIIRCPGCQAMLLSDTSQCPSCDYVLDAGDLPRWEGRSSSNRHHIKEEPCANCGEMVRIGLVRCWSCGTFVREDIEEAYRIMQSAPHRVIYSPLPTGSPQPAKKAPSAPYVPATDDGEDSDYELGVGYQPRQPVDEMPPPTPAESSPESDTPPPPPIAGEIPDAASRSADDDESAIPHSIATGGEALLDVALREQKEEQLRKRARKKQRLTGPRSATGVLVFCPNGHRIEVDRRYRGMTGRCPKCRAPFFVPPQDKATDDAGTQGAAVEAQPESKSGKFTHWMNDVHVHSVNPERLRLKPGSLKPDFQLFDFGFADDEILVAAYSKRKGAAPAKTKKQAADREKLEDFLRTGGPLSDAPVAEKLTLTADQAKAITIAQPALYPHESLFADVAVFGEGHIAVRLPVEDDPKLRRFASFTLSEFREFARILEADFGMSGLGEDVEIPLKDEFKEAKCHYSEATIRYLDPVAYYEADPSLKLQLVGRKCQNCGLIISEDSRKKEKIGGVNGKAIAKAKCPKCQQKFGTISLFMLETPPEPAKDEQPGEAAVAS